MAINRYVKLNDTVVFEVKSNIKDVRYLLDRKEVTPKELAEFAIQLLEMLPADTYTIDKETLEHIVFKPLK